VEFLTVDTPEIATLRLQSEMECFRKDKGYSVNLLRFSWENIWRELVNMAIYRRGPDIAEIGSTWLESLVAMQSLNLFSASDINQIGGKEIFFPAAWQNVAMSNQKEIWGMPFRADARVIFYWKDMFENASVDASEAFSTTGDMAASFTKLQEAGIPAWIAPTKETHNTVYAIASWIWGAGGDFLSSDGKRTDFGSPAARRGIQAYFDLLRFMPQQTSPFTDGDALQLFFARKAAAMAAGPWLLNSLRLQNDMEKWMPHLGMALLPGPSFVGGTLLVIWKHSKYPTDAVDLIKRLTSTGFQSEYCLISGLLPVRQDLWTEQFINSQEYLPVFNKAMRTGRGLPPTALWGLVEDRLSKTLAAIWQDLYALNMPGKPINTLDKIIARHFESLSMRLDITLSTSNEPHDDI
jgi:multiple sugar transport system substrate-binding protein